MSSVHGNRSTAPTLGRPEAAELIWTWRETSAKAAAPVSYLRIRKMGSLQAAAGAVAGMFFLWLGWTGLARGVFAIASLLLLSALLSPGGLYAILDRAARRLAQRIGSVLMWALMVPVFYLFFFPFGVLFRRGRRDPLKRFMQPESPTYWEPHEGPTAASTSHTSQF